MERVDLQVQIDELRARLDRFNEYVKIIDLAIIARSILTSTEILQMVLEENLKKVALTDEKLALVQEEINSIKNFTHKFHEILEKDSKPNVIYF